MADKQIEELLRKLDLNITLQREILSVLKKSIYEVEELVKDPLFEGIDNDDAKVVLKFIIEYSSANKTNSIPIRAIVNGTGLSRRRVVNAIQYLNDNGYNFPIKKVNQLENSRENRKQKEENRKK